MNTTNSLVEKGKKRIVTMKIGRPSNYRPEMVNETVEYITKVYVKEEAVPTIAGLSLYLGISREKVYSYAEENEDFRNVVRNLMALQEKQLLTGALKNKLNASISKLMLVKHGYRDESTTEYTASKSFLDALSEAKKIRELETRKILPIIEQKQNDE